MYFVLSASFSSSVQFLSASSCPICRASSSCCLRISGGVAGEAQPEDFLPAEDTFLPLPDARHATAADVFVWLLSGLGRALLGGGST